MVIILISCELDRDSTPSLTYVVSSLWNLGSVSSVMPLLLLFRVL